MDRRIEGVVGEDLAEPAHVQPAWLPVGEQVGASQRLVVDEGVVVRADAAGQPAAAVLPGTDQGRQDGERAVEHRPVVVVLGADQGADRRGADRAVVGGETFDLGGVEPAHGCGPLRCPLGDMVGELGEPGRVGGDPRVVGEPVADEHVHHRQHQSDVGTRQRLDELVGGVGGDRAQGIDDDDLGAVGRGRLRSSATGGGWSAGCSFPRG